MIIAELTTMHCNLFFNVRLSVVCNHLSELQGAAMGSCRLGSPRHNLTIVHDEQLAWRWNAYTR